MQEPSDVLPSRQDWRRGRSEAIRKFVQEFAPGPNEELLCQMMVTLCRLAADGTSRGDVKILNTALKELRYAFKVFAPFGDIPKVSIFGSARTPETHPQYHEARKFAELIQARGWMVITGAGDGIMRAGHHGATRGSSFGVAISLPFEQATNTIIADDPKLVTFKYFFTRKLIFVKQAMAIVLFPGGFGTQDEGFEALTLVQTMKTSPTPVVLCEEPGGTYWQHWRTYVKAELLGNRMIDAADMNLFYITDRAELAVDEIVRFYKRYHSCRYVGDQLVMRINEPISTEMLASLNEAFSDITRGTPILQHAGPIEGENNVYPDKTRLIFAFDRRSAGRLRMMINLINQIE